MFPGGKVVIVGVVAREGGVGVSPDRLLSTKGKITDLPAGVFARGWPDNPPDTVAIGNLVERLLVERLLVVSPGIFGHPSLIIDETRPHGVRPLRRLRRGRLWIGHGEPYPPTRYLCLPRHLCPPR